MCMHPSIWPSICVCVWEWDINMNIIIVHTCFCFSVNTFLLEIRSLTDIVLQVSWPGLSVGLCKKEVDEKGRKWEERTVYNHTDWMTLKSLGPALTNTAAYWHSKSTGWLSALLSLPSNTHTHTHSWNWERLKVWALPLGFLRLDNNSWPVGAERELSKKLSTSHLP